MNTICTASNTPKQIKNVSFSKQYWDLLVPVHASIRYRSRLIKALGTIERLSSAHRGIPAGLSPAWIPEPTDCAAKGTDSSAERENRYKHQKIKVERR